MTLSLPDHSWQRWASYCLLAAAGYVVLARLCLSLGTIGGSASPFWLPTGLVMGLPLLLGYRILPGIFLGQLLSGMLLEQTHWWVPLAEASGNVMEGALFRCLALRFMNGDDLLGSVRNFLGVLPGAVLGGMVNAAFGVSALCLSGAFPSAMVAQIFLTWFVGDLGGALIILPLLYAWRYMDYTQWRGQRLLELGGTLLLTLALAYLVFFDVLAVPVHPLVFMLLPLLLYGSFRFKRCGMSLLNVMLVGVAIVGTTHGHGPFAAPSTVTSVLLLQVFTSVLIVTSLLVMIINGERQRMLQQLQDSAAELERRVAERTAGLDEVNRELRESELSLRRSEQRFRLLLESAHSGIWGLDLQGNTTFVNPAAARMLGYRADELIGKPMHATVHHSFANGNPYPRARCPMYETFVDGRPRTVSDEVLWRKDGSCFPVEYSTYPIVQDDRLAGAVVVFQDITERKRIEDKLIESETRFRKLFEDSAEAIMLVEGDHFVDCNLSALKMLKLQSSAQIRSLRPSDISPPYQPDGRSSEEKSAAMIALAYQRGSNLFEWEHVRADGEPFIAEVMLTPIAYGAKRLLHTVLRDITERKHIEKALQENERRLRQMLELSPVAVRIMRWSDRSIVFANQRYADIFHADMARIIGCDPKWFYQSAEEYERIGQVLATGEDITDREVGLRTLDGKNLWVLASYFHLEYEGVPAILGWFYDVTELRNARNMAEEMARLKSEFLANMSHEIRTPMNAILGLSQLALDKPVTPEVRDYLGNILASSQSLMDILNDILDLSKIEAGGLTIEKAYFDLHELIGELDDLFHPRATQKGLDFTLAIEAGVPCGLVGDALRLRQILSNLLSNAIKFTDQGHVALTVHQEKLENNLAWLRIVVADSGIGMTEAQAGQLFQAFTQADGTIARRFGGSGLGLAICRRLTELMGGSIALAGVGAGAGSTFVVNLPFAVHEQDAAATMRRRRSDHAPAAFRQAARHLRGKRVLLVDDNALNQRVAREYLQNAGLLVTVSSSGREALDQMRQQRYDLVLMDVQMPDMDGLEATRRIRADSRLADCPVVAMSAGVTLGEQEKCRQAGMDDFIGKPIDPAHMLNTLLAILAPAAPAVQSEPVSGQMQMGSRYELAGFDDVRLTSISEMLGDDALLKEMLDIFRQDFADIDLEIGRLQQQGDAIGARNKAHSLKGAASNIGAYEVQALAADIEAGLRGGNEVVEELPRLRSALRTVAASIAAFNADGLSGD